MKNKEQALPFFQQLKEPKDIEWQAMFETLAKENVDIVNLDNQEELPRLAIYPKRDGNPRGCIIVCAGGAFVFKSANEAKPVADYFYANGFHTAILDYRVSPFTQKQSAEDGNKAVRYMKLHSEDYNIQADKVALLGFSAGGMLANLSATLYQNELERPDAVILGYGTFSDSTDIGTLGFDINKQRELARECPDLLLTPDCPPYFMFATLDDDPRNIAHFQIRLTEHGIPFEAHTFAVGSHGGGLYDGEHGTDYQPHTSKWTILCQEWLEIQNFNNQ